MRWPFRRSPGGDSSPDAAAVSVPEQPAPPPARAAAWRDLPGGTSVLGAMPSATDPGFSRSLPSRWHNPPALGPLGHEVRTDVPGGLAGGVARTVDPLDTRPADLVWRLPQTTAPATGANQEPNALASARAPARPAATTTAAAAATTTAASAGTRVPAPGTNPGGRSAGRPSAVSVPSSGDAETVTATGALASPAGGTAQTRQALPEAVAAVEARDPRPVPADVTDGLTAAAPDRGAHAEPDPGRSESPPDAPAAGFGTSRASREARPGPDPQGSAPAVAPLVSRDPLPRSSSRALVEAPGAAMDSPGSPPSVSAGQSAAEQSSEQSAQQPRASADEAPATVAPNETQEADSPGDEPATAAPWSAPSQSAQSAQSATGAEPGPVVSPVVTGAAPLVSATRFSPAAAAISVLRPPATPVDRPARETESIVGAFANTAPGVGLSAGQAPMIPLSASALTALGAGTAPSARAALSSPSADAAGAQASTMSSSPRAQAGRAVNTALAGPNSPADAGLGDQSPAGAAERPRPVAGASAPGTTRSPGPGAAAIAGTALTTAAVHDPAVLDTLARQLYGRFSRRLAGELLIDRERAQLLNDLH